MEIQETMVILRRLQDIERLDRFEWQSILIISRIVHIDDQSQGPWLSSIKRSSNLKLPGLRNAQHRIHAGEHKIS